MVYTILISIVFIAEIIIAVTVIQNLLRLDKAVIELNETVEEANPKIRGLSCLVKKISEQAVELSKDFVIRFKEEQDDFVLRKLSKVLMAILLLKINSRAINAFRKSRAGKFIVKGLSMLGNMV